MNLNITQDQEIIDPGGSRDYWKEQVLEYNDFWEWYEDHFPYTKDELFEMFDEYQKSLPDEHFNLNKIN